MKFQSIIGNIKVRYIFALAALATGVALLIYFLTGIALWLGLLVTVSLALAISALVWWVIPIRQQQRLRRRASAGVLAGILATLGYDLSRLLLVRIADFSLWPFDTFRLFGQLFVGSTLPSEVVLLIGIGYHILNGVSFGLAYTLLFGQYGWKAGIIWAMGLEILMVSFYPGWLDLKALDEFLSISVVGHVVYGVILGYYSRKLLYNNADADHPSAPMKS
jgi:hypothetical protein